MKRIKRLTLGLLLLATCVCALQAQDAQKIKRESIEWLDIWAPQTNNTSLPRVLLIGNSIARLYRGEVEKQLEGKANVVRLSTSKSIGDPALLEEISLIMHQYKFDVVHFNNGMHGFDYTEDEYAAAFPKFFETIKNNAPQAKLIWATTTPRRTGEGMKDFDKITERINVRNRIAADYFKDKPEVKTDDLYSVISRNPIYYEGGDGTHPNALGVKALANRVADEILTSLNESSNLTYFPAGYTPEEVGKKLGYHFLQSKHYFPDQERIVYPEVCTWLGALRFGKVANDNVLIQQLQKRFEPLFNERKDLLPVQNHVDFNMFGSLPLEFYQITKDKRFYNLGLTYADTQWAVPDTANAEAKAWAKKGYTWQTRLWIDDMFMITIVQAQAYRATGNPKYINRAAKEMVMYLKDLQQPNGLFYHAPDVPYYWGRGNGWMAAGMAELLSVLPEHNPDRAKILEGYKTMMKSLKDYQYNDGMWNQLINEPTFWPETSGSAMFTYAMILGVKHGWLDAKEYTPIARKAWLGLVNYINENGDVMSVCYGTNKKNDRQYYYDRPQITGDFHGQAPVLWCAYALLSK